MIEYAFPSVRWFQSGNIFSGSIREDDEGLACFQYRAKQEKQEEGGPLLRVWAWYSEKCFGCMDESQCTIEAFPLSEEGREAAIAWLTETRRQILKGL